MSNKHIIKTIHAFVVDGSEGEGLAGFMNGAVFMPMVAADEARIESLKGVAREIATATKRPIKILRFSVREQVDTIEPDHFPDVRKMAPKASE